MAIVRATKSTGEQIVAASTDVSTQPDGSAADKTTMATRPERVFVIVGGALFFGGLIAGLFLLDGFHGDVLDKVTNLPTVAKGTSAFAVLYVFAQAIERLLVPVSWFGGGGFSRKSTKKALKEKSQTAQVNLLRAVDEDKPQAAEKAAEAQHAVDQYRANLTATSFGAASLLAFLACGYSGALLLHIAGIDVTGWLDLIVTALAVAGGTKPLHDVISNVSSSAATKSS